MNIAIALKLATRVHAEQTDKVGAPYILHLFRVMNRVATENEKIVALLHDTMEDCGVTRDDLAREGFSEEVIGAVEALTHGSGESYTDFVRRAATNPIARAVKIADLEDNMDIRRLPEVTEKDVERLRKYLKHWRMLTFADTAR